MRLLSTLPSSLAVSVLILNALAFRMRLSYHFKYFSNAYTALSTASKTSIRLQPNGIMSIQCIFPPGQDDHVPVDEGLTRNGFVDMLITPLASDEEELY